MGLENPLPNWLAHGMSSFAGSLQEALVPFQRLLEGPKAAPE